MALFAADRARLAEIEAERCILRQKLDSYIYPILQLPNELTANIFMLYLPPYPEPPPLAGPGSPTTLAQVCRQWRRIALGLSALWSTIPLDDWESSAAGVSCWIERSGARPLSLHVVDHGVEGMTDDLTNVILSASGRWEHVEFHTWQYDGTLEGTFPLLRSIEIRAQQPGVWQIGIGPPASVNADRKPQCDAPKLRSAILWDFHIPINLLPWRQLTALVLICHEPTFCAAILKQTPNLVYCELLAVDGALPDDDIILPHLHTLVLTEYDLNMDDIAISFLGKFITPALRQLRVLSQYLLPNPVDVLRCFVDRTGCKKLEVHVLGEPIDFWADWPSTISIISVPQKCYWTHAGVADRSREILTDFAYKE
ncbi:F-box domain-containing protein [Mycena kentingensis (nom. inval.)]|nr:F-box domain-containing protein [Mycena kentingensis (nom. inval.)]